MTQIRFLSSAEVRQALPMADAIIAMKSAYEQLSAGAADMPLRGRTHTASEGVLLTMPAYLKASAELGVKLVSVFPQNAEQGLPIIHAMVLAFDAQTGQPLALMEGGELTAIRTGAGAGAATDYLAREDARSVAIIGSGVQARTQLMAVCAVRPIERAFVYSRDAQKLPQFAAMAEAECNIPVTITTTADEAVSQVDIVCTATTSTTPVFSAEALRPGTHINAVGSYRPDMQEVSSETLRSALIVVDNREAVLAECGELIMAIAEGAITPESIHGEIGEVITGVQPGRSHPDQITYFKSVGVAVQDAAAAAMALRNAEREGIGTLLAL